MSWRPSRGLAWRMAAIEIDGLSKHFGSVQAVNDLSFTVDAGKVTGFLGPNGAGKSTTLRMLLGLIHSDRGTATFAGRRYGQLPHPSAHVGAVLEHASFHPGRSGRNHLRVLAAAGDHPPSRVDDTLEQVGMTDAADRRVKGYSMGMRQRLALAAALLGDPAVLILDEPTNGLDPPGIRWVRDFVRARLTGRGTHLQPPACRGRAERRRRRGDCRRAAACARCHRVGVGARVPTSRSCAPAPRTRGLAAGPSRTAMVEVGWARTSCWCRARPPAPSASWRRSTESRSSNCARTRCRSKTCSSKSREISRDPLLRAELLKLRTTRTFAAFVGLAIVTSAPDRGTDPRSHRTDGRLRAHRSVRRPTPAVSSFCCWPSWGSPVSGVIAPSPVRCWPRRTGSASSPQRRWRSRLPVWCCHCSSPRR